MHHLYLITCLVTGKQYVGQTSMKPSRRFGGHAKTGVRDRHYPITRAFAKHGRDAMRMEVVAMALTADAAHEAERALIIQYGTLVPHGYNVSHGGKGTPGVKKPPDVRRRISVTQKGRVFTAEHRQLLAAAKRGRPRTEETKERLRAANTGKTLPAAHRAKIAESVRLTHAIRIEREQHA